MKAFAMRQRQLVHREKAAQKQEVCGPGVDAICVQLLFSCSDRLKGCCRIAMSPFCNSILHTCALSHVTQHLTYLCMIACHTVDVLQCSAATQKRPMLSQLLHPGFWCCDS